jgi:hypothetical protein
LVVDKLLVATTFLRGAELLPAKILALVATTLRNKAEAEAILIYFKTNITLEGFSAADKCS